MPTKKIIPVTMKLTDNAKKVLKYRYLTKDNTSKVTETPEQLMFRVATAISSCEKSVELRAHWQKKYYEMLCNLDFVPNTPCLVNAGKSLNQLSACFVLPIGDSIESIFQTLRHAALVHKSGGGTGFSFSGLRPAGSLVKETNGISSGPISFMRVYDAATKELKQGGVRRGANMGILSVHHPDIEEFINCKSTEGDFAEFNISVSITDKFMKSYTNNNKHYSLHFNGSKKRLRSPRKIMRMIAEKAWKNGEPGVVFIDSINKNNLLADHETIEATNPCGEQPQPPYGNCCLGAINLENLITAEGIIDWNKFAQLIRKSVRFLDSIIDVQDYVIPEIGMEAKKKRKIGLGLMGFAGLCIRLGIRYGSKQCIKLADEISSFLSATSIKASEIIGNEKGIPEFLQFTGNITRRNALTTTIAPTGSTSLIAGVDSGIEPVFSFEFKKKCMGTGAADYDELTIVHPLVKEYYDKHKLDLVKGTLPDYFVDASQVTPEEHINVQAAFQKHIHSAISKTINMPNNATVEDVEKAIVYAYEQGCKSVTVYREGSRSVEAQTRINEKETPIKKDYGTRPKRLSGTTEAIKTARGKLYVTTNIVQDKPFEVFLKIGKSGKDDFAYSEALGRMISLALRTGVDIRKIIRHLEHISGDEVVWSNGVKITSIPDAVAKVLTGLFVKDGEKLAEEPASKPLCPDCKGDRVNVSEGCAVCTDCGWSKC